MHVPSWHKRSVSSPLNETTPFESLASSANNASKLVVFRYAAYIYTNKRSSACRLSDNIELQAYLSTARGMYCVLYRTCKELLIPSSFISMNKRFQPPSGWVEMSRNKRVDFTNQRLTSSIRRQKRYEPLAPRILMIT